MSSRAEDFPTPVSPTRRMVNGGFALSFEVLMIPCLRLSTLLEMPSALMHRRGRCNLLGSGDVTLIIVSEGVPVWASRTMFGSDPVTTRGHRSESLAVHRPGKTHGLGVV